MSRAASSPGSATGDHAPAVVATYLEAKSDTDVSATVSCFAPEAIVHDEGEDHVGIAAIQQWADRVGSAYRLTRTVRSVRTTEAATVVQLEIAGNFPGSPVNLHHHFTVVGDRIAALTICP